MCHENVELSCRYLQIHVDAQIRIRIPDICVIKFKGQKQDVSRSLAAFDVSPLINAWSLCDVSENAKMLRAEDIPRRSTI